MEWAWSGLTGQGSGLTGQAKALACQAGLTGRLAYGSPDCVIEQTRVIFTVQSRNDSKMILRVLSL